MSANATLTTPLSATAIRSVPEAERQHRLRLYALYALAITVNTAIFFYGFDYYKLSSIDRPFSPKHHLLRPSGPVGLYLGFFGVALFLGIFVYPIRKHWPWLATIGSTRHWLDIHVLMGLTAPFIVALHSTLKFRGIAGMAFWIMFAVSASGVVGRYLYAQIPRKMTTAELSMQELRDLQSQLTQQLADSTSSSRSRIALSLAASRREPREAASHCGRAGLHGHSRLRALVANGAFAPSCRARR